MSITTREPATPSALQRFRLITEGYLVQVAQREMLRSYPRDGVAPVPQRGLIYRVLPLIFLPGFRLTPWPIRRRLLTMFFVSRVQHWPEPCWGQADD